MLNENLLIFLKKDNMYSTEVAEYPHGQIKIDGDNSLTLLLFRFLYFTSKRNITSELEKFVVDGFSC